ncbi:expressed unknown protein [Seminavis robusta]|uniref:Uncharacterized protein n=1 Tax=Seminavis robusta TaxID=568900 RepID=A0A9N8H988_9STRA|nr:expressed unknown protein [Seminavis robusta]|eukprot:Sro110_g055060.1 n/a (1053) ;mRNA; r:98800-101958
MKTPGRRGSKRSALTPLHGNLIRSSSKRRPSLPSFLAKTPKLRFKPTVEKSSERSISWALPWNADTKTPQVSNRTAAAPNDHRMPPNQYPSNWKESTHTLEEQQSNHLTDRTGYKERRVGLVGQSKKSRLNDDGSDMDLDSDTTSAGKALDDDARGNPLGNEWKANEKLSSNDQRSKMPMRQVAAQQNRVALGGRPSETTGHHNPTLRRRANISQHTAYSDKYRGTHLLSKPSPDDKAAFYGASGRPKMEPLNGLEIGGRRTQLVASLDEDDVTLDSLLSGSSSESETEENSFDYHFTKDLYDLGSGSEASSDSNGSVLTNHAVQQNPVHHVDGSQHKPGIRAVEQDSLEIWTQPDDEASTTSMEFSFEMNGRSYLHPPLPSGWTLRVSKDLNRPFYCHPEREPTFYCPVILPRRPQVGQTNPGAQVVPPVVRAGNPDIASFSRNQYDEHFIDAVLGKPTRKVATASLGSHHNRSHSLASSNDTRRKSQRPKALKHPCATGTVSPAPRHPVRMSEGTASLASPSLLKMKKFPWHGDDDDDDILASPPLSQVHIPECFRLPLVFDLLGQTDEHTGRPPSAPTAGTDNHEESPHTTRKQTQDESPGGDMDLSSETSESNQSAKPRGASSSNNTEAAEPAESTKAEPRNEQGGKANANADDASGEKAASFAPDTPAADSRLEDSTADTTEGQKKSNSEDDTILEDDSDNFQSFPSPSDENHGDGTDDDKLESPLSAKPVSPPSAKSGSQHTTTLESPVSTTAGSSPHNSNMDESPAVHAAESPAAGSIGTPSSSASKSPAESSIRSEAESQSQTLLKSAKTPARRANKSKNSVITRQQTPAKRAANGSVKSIDSAQSSIASGRAEEMTPEEEVPPATDRGHSTEKSTKSSQTQPSSTRNRDAHALGGLARMATGVIDRSADSDGASYNGDVPIRASMTSAGSSSPRVNLEKAKFYDQEDQASKVGSSSGSVRSSGSPFSNASSHQGSQSAPFPVPSGSPGSIQSPHSSTSSRWYHYDNRPDSLQNLPSLHKRGKYGRLFKFPPRCPEGAFPESQV